MDWENLKHFLAFAREGSFSAAARALRVEHATVARQIAQLEGELGVKLLRRDGKRISLTVIGREMLVRVKHMEEYVREIENYRLSSRNAPGWDIHVAAPSSYISNIFGKAAAKMTLQFPSIKWSFETELPTSGVTRSTTVMVVSIGDPIAHSISTHRLEDVTFGIYGPANYINSREAGSYMISGSNQPLSSFKETRIEEFLPNDIDRFLSVDVYVQCGLSEVGLGLAILPDYMGCDCLPLTKINGPASPKIAAWLNVVQQGECGSQLDQLVTRLVKYIKQI